MTARAALDQYRLFEDNAWRSSFRVVEKLPYDFYYTFKDVRGKKSRMKILDWEVGALYRNCIRNADGVRGHCFGASATEVLESIQKNGSAFFCGNDTTISRNGTESFYNRWSFSYSTRASTIYNQDIGSYGWGRSFNL